MYSDEDVQGSGKRPRQHKKPVDERVPNQWRSALLNTPGVAKNLAATVQNTERAYIEKQIQIRRKELDMIKTKQVAEAKKKESAIRKEQKSMIAASKPKPQSSIINFMELIYGCQSKIPLFVAIN